MCAIVVAGAFAGCAKTKADDSPFAIYNKYENIRVDIGDKRDDVAKLMGIDEQYSTLYEEDNIERIEYWDHENVGIEYDLGINAVIGMRFENPQWSISNGLKVGDSTDTVRKQYPADMIYNSEENYLFIAYGKDGNIIEYSEDAPYIVVFIITDGKVEEILVRNEAAYPKA